ncbi:MAG TPA: DUF1707 domain-containing protein [Streptosporangiaceae bacterium]|nr:DUF1707 domain-containing protein [Streptosporangiaceae bacterium]
MTGESPELRASHQDREQAAEVIRIAAGDGRLTADELDDRLEKALTARTTGELAQLTADLPAAPGPPGAVTAQPKDLVEIECLGGNASRVGDWVVPRRMEIRATGGNVKLDFTEAVITGPTLQIDAAVRGGNLILVTRPGLEVDADGVKMVGGSLKLRPARGPGQPVLLRVELAGAAWGGNVVVRPRRRTLWQWLLRRPRE